MLTIDQTALDAAKKVNGSFVATVYRAPICCSGGTVRTINIDLHTDFTSTSDTFQVYDYEGVKVYVSKDLKLKEKASIYKKLSIPGIGPIFGTKGVLPVDDDKTTL
jgi:hypothetical protein